MSGSDHAESARAVYDASANRYVEFVGAEINPRTEAAIDRSLLMAFAELMRAGPEGLVADIGCGPGRVAAFLAGHGLDVAGVDVSPEMLVAARRAHPHLRFEEGRLAALPFGAEALSGAVCWYSIIYTPPEQLPQVFDELARVLIRGGHVLFGFQAGEGQSLHRAEAHGTNLPLSSYLHSPTAIAAQLEAAGFVIHASVVRAPELEHESTSQAFVLARRPTSRS